MPCYFEQKCLASQKFDNYSSHLTPMFKTNTNLTLWHVLKHQLKLWHVFSDMGTNACVSDGLRSSTFSDCVAEVNEKYALSDASCEYVQNVASHCQAIYSLKNNGKPHGYDVQNLTSRNRIFFLVFFQGCWRTQIMLVDGASWVWR